MNALALVEGVERYDLSRLSDGDVLAGARRLAGTSNQLLADLLAHLAEVEARGIHRLKACASLYTYCIYELRFSEDEAFRRASAARWTKTFPVLLDAVATGELHLTGLLMLAPHLTQQNLQEMLARARFRTKKELARLIRQIDPLPDVPARIEPLGPAEDFAPKKLRAPTWEQYVTLRNPVRQLRPDEQPRSWIDPELMAAEGSLAERSAETSLALVDEACVGANPAPAGVNGCDGACPAPARVDDCDGACPAPARVGAGHGPAPARVEVTQLTPLPKGPQRYRVQFTATQEYADLVERAQALLSAAGVGSSLAELHLRAMQALVQVLEKRKLGAKRGEASCDVREVEDAGKEPPLRRGRAIPAVVRRAVYERDEARCTYIDTTGIRCAELRHLEFHHLVPFALGGEHAAQNITLRCRAHNALAAEQDFGREAVAERRGGSRHESQRRQRAP